MDNLGNPLLNDIANSKEAAYFASEVWKMRPELEKYGKVYSRLSSRAQRVMNESFVRMTTASEEERHRAAVELSRLVPDLLPVFGLELKQNRSSNYSSGTPPTSPPSSDTFTRLSTMPLADVRIALGIQISQDQ